ncbi:Tachykinin-like peptides receptor 99D-like [Homarus americanus]|uniref:Tachykinin-like peptides receptor 99D-like n=1 Tax=Homarus americanus TaxID=6706 RepID=A0A8J5NCX7_HOMAM|nr:Tachykinin-like peptides receptor 99D-like [Homarus americanus]
MRSSTNQYLVNLAVADLLVTLLCTWVHLVRNLSHPHHVLPAIFCKLDGFAQVSTPKLFYIILNTAFYFLPVSIMVISYSLVVWRLWMTWLPGEHCVPARNTATRAKKKVVKMVSVVLLVFVVGRRYRPSSSTVTSVHVDHNSLPEWFEWEFSAYFIALSNSALNPIIYCGFNDNFRKGLMSSSPADTPLPAYTTVTAGYTTVVSITVSGGRIHHRREITCQTAGYTTVVIAVTDGRIHHRRNWRGVTEGTRDTTGGGSGPEPVVVLSLIFKQSRSAEVLLTYSQWPGLEDERLEKDLDHNNLKDDALDPTWYYSGLC